MSETALQDPWEARGAYLFSRTLALPDGKELDLIVFAEKIGPPWLPGPSLWRWEAIRPEGTTLASGTPDRREDPKFAAREVELFAMGVHAGMREGSKE